MNPNLNSNPPKKMSEESNPYIKMTEEELLESCAIEDGAQRAVKLVQEWLRTRRRARIERQREEQRRDSA